MKGIGKKSRRGNNKKKRKKRKGKRNKEIGTEGKRKGKIEEGVIRIRKGVMTVGTGEETKREKIGKIRTREKVREVEREYGKGSEMLRARGTTGRIIYRTERKVYIRVGRKKIIRVPIKSKCKKAREKTKRKEKLKKAGERRKKGGRPRVRKKAKR